MSLGETIKEAREAEDVSVADLAERVGVTANTVYRWQRDEVTPSWTHLHEIARALDCVLVVGLEPSQG